MISKKMSINFFHIHKTHVQAFPFTSAVPVHIFRSQSLNTRRSGNQQALIWGTFFPSFELYSIACQKKKLIQSTSDIFISLVFFTNNKSIWYLVRTWCYQLDPVKISISFAMPFEKPTGTELYYLSLWSAAATYQINYLSHYWLFQFCSEYTANTKHL